MHDSSNLGEESLHRANKAGRDNRFGQRGGGILMTRRDLLGIHTQSKGSARISGIALQQHYQLV